MCYYACVVLSYITVCPARDGTGIMFLNEAVLGKEHHITVGDGSLTAPPTNYDCIIAKGRTEPGNNHGGIL